MLLFKIALVISIIRVVIMFYEFIFVGYTGNSIGNLIAESFILAGLLQANKVIGKIKTK